MARADEVKPAESQPEVSAPRIPLRVVRILPETHQALLFDKNRATHVLADIGSTIDGYRVEGIDDDEVTLSSQSGTELVLAGPDPTWKRRGKHRRASEADRKPHDSDSAQAGPRPEDPYGEPEVRASFAPHEIEAGEGGVRVADSPRAPNFASAPSPTMDATTGTSLPATSTPIPSVSAANIAPMDATSSAEGATSTRFPVPAAEATATAAAPTATLGASLGATLGGTPPLAKGTVVLTRIDVNASLADFSKLVASVRGAFVPTGVRIDGLAEGSLLVKAGLRAGDVVTAVDGRPLRSLDDTAELYARAGAARQVALQIVRAGKPVALRIMIQ